MNGQGAHQLVMVADDNQDLAWSVSMLLELAGFDVKTVFDGEAAINAAGEHLPDIALLDIGLPGSDGLAVARKIRQIQGEKHVLVIAISGYHAEIVQKNPNYCAFDYHLVKPVNFDALLPLLSVAC